MTVRIGTGLSTAPDLHDGAAEAADAAAAGLAGEYCDLVAVFASGAHLHAPEATLEAVHETLAPAALIGCGAGGTIADGREIEGGTSVAVWAASFGGGIAEPFHATVDGTQVSGIPDLDGATGVILIADPGSFPTDPVLRALSARTPALPLLGGLASAVAVDGSAALFLDEEVVGEGAIGVRFEGIEIVSCVSQGAAPVGPELTVTAGEGHVIEELAGRPALDKLRDVVDSLDEDERRLLESGLLLGLVIGPPKPEYLQGDFLVRGIVGADPSDGRIAVGTEVRPGQVVRLHARDAESADRDLRAGLAARRSALPGGSAAGALVFACNGRGKNMFGVPGHDASVLAGELAGAPAAGFFAAGEIGPVGDEYFLHGFTATVAVFGR